MRATGPGVWADRAVEVLAGGGIVAHPTETLYGLAVDPWNSRAVARLAALKERGPAPGFILLAYAPREARELVADPPPEHFLRLARSFWPGPLTLVAAPSPRAPREVLGVDGSLAVRVTPDPVAVEIIARFGRPLTSTSANLRGGTAAGSAQEVAAGLGDSIDLIVDGGPRPRGEPSTLVDLTGPGPVVLREGAVSAERLGRVLGLRVPLRIA